MVEKVKRFVMAFAVLCAAGASAFSSEKWLAERGDDSDMLRLRAAFEDCRKKAEAPAEDVLIPLETYPDGTVKSRISAARAHIFPNSGFVYAEKIRVEQYKEDGKTLSASLDAENCVVDRMTKSGWVEGSAQMVYGESSVRGRGIYFSLTREFIKIFSESEIRTKGGKVNPGSLIK